MNASPDTLALRVASADMLTPGIRRLHLVAAQEGEPLPPFEPGAHIRLQVALPDGSQDWREYSLIDLVPQTHATQAPDGYLVAIRLESGGRGGSRFIHEQLQADQTLAVLPPRNQFPMEASGHRAVLIAGGIGVTPLASMAAWCKLQQRPVVMHYAGRSRQDMALLEELNTLLGDALHVHADDERGSPLNITALFDGLEANDHLYFCGPQPMIDAILAEAERRAWPREQVHFELFGAPIAQEGDQPFEVELALSGQTLQVPADKSVLDVLIDAGLDPLFDCKRGECGVCATGVLSGDIDHRDYILTEREKAAGNIMHTCVSRCHGKRLVLDL